MSGKIAIKDGAIYLPSDLVEIYFKGIDAVIVLIQQGELRVMPVHQASSGGSLLKVRNAVGDRVVQARDVFQDQDLLDYRAEALSVEWQTGKGALCAEINADITKPDN